MLPFISYYLAHFGSYYPVVTAGPNFFSKASIVYIYFFCWLSIHSPFYYWCYHDFFFEKWMLPHFQCMWVRWGVGTWSRPVQSEHSITLATVTGPRIVMTNVMTQWLHSGTFMATVGHRSSLSLVGFTKTIGYKPMNCQSYHTGKT